jgi:imidazolonepropionase
MNRSKTHGSLEVGKFGDCVIIDSENWEHIVYELVNSPILKVIKRGKVVFENDLKIIF